MFGQLQLKKIIAIIQNEYIILFLLILIFLVSRSINYDLFLNFSHDQGTFSIKALEIFKNRTITLIGPSTSIVINGREVFQGSIVYYLQLLFLLLGRFNPILSSYYFMVFCSLTTIPLYFGSKLFLDKKSAFFIVVIYTLFPFFIDYTRFLWSPNFQLSLMPFLILFMGLFRYKPKKIFIFLIGFLSGILTQIHYEFLFVLFILAIFYFVIEKIKNIYKTIFILGFILGISTLVIFELRHNFYNLQTVFLFLKYHSQMNSQNYSIRPHYFLSLTLLALLFLVNSAKKFINYKINCVLLIMLSLIFMRLYFIAPSHAFGMSSSWNYLDEDKVHQIIIEQKLSSFNVANLVYDTLASVQKYLLEEDGVSIKYYDYANIKYLFVISSNSDFQKSGPYEVNVFKPSKIIDIWQINSTYNLYLLQK